MKNFVIFLLILCAAVSSFAIQIGTLTASPTFALKGEPITLSITIAPATEVGSTFLMLYNSSTESTEMYVPTISGNTYAWIYTPQYASNFRAQAKITLKSTSATLLSNVATFTTDIPAASVNSTIVYVPFITNATQTWNVKATNIGSKSLTFTTFSSPSGLSIFPENGSIQPGKSLEFKVNTSGVFFPGSIYTLNALMKTNDPRENHSQYLLASVVMGPDGLLMSPVKISSFHAFVGSDVNFSFSIWKYGINLNSIYVFWNTPEGQKIVSLSSTPTQKQFSSFISLTAPGTYTLSQIMVNYMYNGTSNSTTYYPNLKVKAMNSSNSMNLNLVNGSDRVGVCLKSSSTPTVYAIDGNLKKELYVEKFKTMWVATYTYLNVPGPVTILATFAGTSYTLSRSFKRYLVIGARAVYFDGGWAFLKYGTFASPTIVSVFSSSGPSKSLYYKGFLSLNQVSNAVSLTSESSPSTAITYHLIFDQSAVNGLYGNLKVYELTGGDFWKPLSTSPEVVNNMATFGAKTGTYTLGLAANVNKSSNPKIVSLSIVPRKLIGYGEVKFVLVVNEDCYYKLSIYDMQDRVIADQSGKALKTLGNLLYVLNPVRISNGLYVVVVSVGPSPSSMTESISKSFVIVR